MPSRSRALSLVLVLLAMAVLATTGGAATRKGALVKVSKTPLGRILVDSRGRTLYLFEGDKSRGRGNREVRGARRRYGS